MSDRYGYGAAIAEAIRGFQQGQASERQAIAFEKDQAFKEDSRERQREEWMSQRQEEAALRLDEMWQSDPQKTVRMMVDDYNQNVDDDTEITGIYEDPETGGFRLKSADGNEMSGKKEDLITQFLAAKSPQYAARARQAKESALAAAKEKESKRKHAIDMQDAKISSAEGIADKNNASRERIAAMNAAAKKASSAKAGGNKLESLAQFKAASEGRGKPSEEDRVWAIEYNKTAVSNPEDAVLSIYKTLAKDRFNMDEKQSSELMKQARALHASMSKGKKPSRSTGISTSPDSGVNVQNVISGGTPGRIKYNAKGERISE